MGHRAELHVRTLRPRVPLKHERSTSLSFRQYCCCFSGCEICCCCSSSFMSRSTVFRDKQFVGTLSCCSSFMIHMKRHLIFYFLFYLLLCPLSFPLTEPALVLKASLTPSSVYLSGTVHEAVTPIILHPTGSGRTSAAEIQG